LGTIKKFEELKCWKLARQLNGVIYRITMSGSFASDYALRDQIRRASISVSSNVAEGFGRSSRKEFIQFLYYALGSLQELNSQLYLAKDLDYLNENDLSELNNQIEKLKSLIIGLTAYLKTTTVQGNKYKVEEEFTEYGDFQFEFN
jgi:four helix bundle protein